MIGGGNMDKILMVMAHPDDEVIFGWPILADTKWDCYILIVSENKHGVRGVRALREVCELNKAHYVDASRIPNNYYRLPPRSTGDALPQAIQTLNQQIENACCQINPQYIFTHNPWGEYGHGDHRMLFDLVALTRLPIIISDIYQPNECHISFNRMPPIYARWLEMSMLKSHRSLDIEWYRRMKAIYDKHQAWSWDGHEVTQECYLYQF